ncbi:hypothetical protein GLOIN_2v1763250 [Rhizophagus irregularis DAOM 181602=DAOM 197198]|nr:hypothetical protein GLOIN_2v1763250 [Rhizophagus irregularis DAOM 181602=DAOM 197198]
MCMAVCTSCHKLHSAKDIIAYQKEGNVAVMNCLHEEFADNPILKCRNKCNNPLLTLKKNKNGIIAVSHMLYLKPSIHIYDGRVWQNFPFDGSSFFTTETAVTHLGLLINLD